MIRRLFMFVIAVQVVGLALVAARRRWGTAFASGSGYADYESAGPLQSKWHAQRRIGLNNGLDSDGYTTIATTTPPAAARSRLRRCA